MRWEVTIPEDAEDALFESMRGGAIIELAEESGANGDLVELRKALVAKANGFKFYIYANEHPPPHFHVMFGGDENSFSLLDATPLHAQGGLRKYFKNVRKWHKENRELLIETWNKTRPADCPVGPVAI